MRILNLLFLLCVVTVLVLGQTLSAPSGPDSSQPTAGSQGVDQLRMRSRAQIQVVPLDLFAANKAQLQSFRERVAQAEAETDRLEISDLAVREQFSRQRQLLRALLSFAETQDADTGKSPTALDVQQHLNRIEGQTLCEACHGRIVLKSGSKSGLVGPWQPGKQKQTGP